MSLNINGTRAGIDSPGMNRQQGTPAKRTGDPNFLKSFRTLGDEKYEELSNGVKMAVLKEGFGEEAEPGMKILVAYSGWLQDGTRFDSSLKRSRPFEFTLGAGQVIKGWEEGIRGMKPGERRQLVIPPQMAYGNRRRGEIPGNSTLVFNVEAIEVIPPSQNDKGNMSVVA